MNKKPKTVKIFGWASFLNDLGSDMIYPLWPLFVTSVLGADMTILGLLDGFGNALVSISQAVSGYLSDKYRKRKIFIWTGYLAGSVSRVGYALSSTWQWLIPFKVLDRAGKIRGAPRDAMVADVSTDKDRGFNFGYLRAMDHAGAVMGIVTSLILFGWLGFGFREIFLLAAIPSIIGAALIFFVIKEKVSRKIHKGMRLKQLGQNFKFFLLLNIIFSLASFSYSFFIIYAKEVGMEMIVIPVFYLLFTVVASASSMPFGKLADKYGRKPIMAVSFLLFALACASTFVASPFVLIILFIFYGLHIGALQPVQKAFVSELSLEAYKASGLGTFQMLTGLAALPASVIAGLLWETFGSWATFSFSGSLAVLAMLLLFLVKEK